MLESSTALILLAFAGWYFHWQREENRLRQIDWVAQALYAHSDLLDQRGDNAAAERASELASSLSSGVGIIRQKLPIHGPNSHEIAMAAKSISGDDWLNRIGLSAYSANYSPTSDALYWIASKFEVQK